MNLEAARNLAINLLDALGALVTTDPKPSQYWPGERDEQRRESTTENQD